MINIKKVPLSYPINTEEAESHLRVEDASIEEAIYIDDLIKEATSLAEAYTDTDISENECTMEVYDFSGGEITIKESPLMSVESIKYLNDAGVEVTVDKTKCKIRKGTTKFYVELPSRISSEKLTIVYKAGYTREDCPASIKKAIKSKIADLYDVERGSMVSGAFKDSGAFERALEYHKRRSF